MNAVSDTRTSSASAALFCAVRDAALRTLRWLQKVNGKGLVVGGVCLVGVALGENLPAPARALTPSPAGDRVVASMALHGFALVRGSDGGILHVEKDVATLNALWLNEEDCLLAGRFSELIVVRFPRAGGARILHRFPCEGIPNHLQRNGTELMVAAGGDGLLLYHWDNPAQAPRVTARFPFVDFTRQSVRGPGQSILLADNLDTGFQVLSQAGRHRLRREAMLKADRVECVAVQGDLAAVGSRRTGTLLVDVSDAAKPRTLGVVRLRGSAAGEQVRELHFVGAGRLLICEGAAGAVLMTLERQGQTVTATAAWRQPFNDGGAACAAVLPGSRVMVAGLDGRLGSYLLP